MYVGLHVGMLLKKVSSPRPAQDQGPALDDLKRIVTRLHPELKDSKSAFWKRRTSVLKVNSGQWEAVDIMRLHAADAGSTVSWQCLASWCSKLVLNCLRFCTSSCLNRRNVACCLPFTPQVHMLLLAHLAREDIPAVLQRDLQFLLTKGLPMLQEMLGLATAPRVKVGAGVHVCGPARKEAGNVGERTSKGRCETIAKQRVSKSAVCLSGVMMLARQS